jgi:hypothetical protein
MELFLVSLPDLLHQDEWNAFVLLHRDIEEPGIDYWTGCTEGSLTEDR